MIDREARQRASADALHQSATIVAENQETLRQAATVCDQLMAVSADAAQAGASESPVVTMVYQDSLAFTANALRALLATLDTARRRGMV